MTAIAGVGAPTLGVIVNIPAAAFELQGRRGYQAVDFAAAFFVGGQRLRTELLYQFESVTAVFALIFVKRHILANYYLGCLSGNAGLFVIIG